MIANIWEWLKREGGWFKDGHSDFPRTMTDSKFLVLRPAKRETLTPPQYSPHLNF